MFSARMMHDTNVHLIFSTLGLQICVPPVRHQPLMIVVWEYFLMQLLLLKVTWETEYLFHWFQKLSLEQLLFDKIVAAIERYVIINDLQNQIFTVT